MNPLTVTDYMENVLQILESFHYDEMVIEYDARDVTVSITATIITNYFMGISPMMTAIIIWSLTLNLQIIPDTRDMVKH